jgi:hypothetical protein
MNKVLFGLLKVGRISYYIIARDAQVLEETIGSGQMEDGTESSVMEEVQFGNSSDKLLVHEREIEDGMGRPILEDVLIPDEVCNSRR